AVLRAVLARDEAEALGLVEPLHGTSGTHSLLLFVPGVIGVRRTRTDRAPVFRGLFVPAVSAVAVRAAQRKRTRTLERPGPLVAGLRQPCRSSFARRALNLARACAQIKTGVWSRVATRPPLTAHRSGS